jgi:hypothetical protein
MSRPSIVIRLPAGPPRGPAYYAASAGERNFAQNEYYDAEHRQGIAVPTRLPLTA